MYSANVGQGAVSLIGQKTNIFLTPLLENIFVKASPSLVYFISAGENISTAVTSLLPTQGTHFPDLKTHRILKTENQNIDFQSWKI